ncbi:MAG: tyrosine-type recombinase/integrase [Oscillospiraceae bacterium]
MNKTCVAITQEEYLEILKVCSRDFIYKGVNYQANHRVKMALTLEANLGIRISDICNLRLKDIVSDGNRYRLDIKEQKTGKKRTFTVPLALYNYISNYCLEHNISKEQRIVPITTRAVQKHLKNIVDYLGYDKAISTHSFRKFFATNIYTKNNYNIVLVQQLLQHSSYMTTQRYIGIGSKELEDALENNLNLV